MKLVYRALCIVFLGVWAGEVSAQTYPTRGITVILPLTAGGAMDVIARVVTSNLSDRLGKPVTIDNRPGGGTLIGAGAAAKSAPDGYTLFAAPSGTLTTNVSLYKSLPYDPVKDFIPIALYTRVPFVLVVNPELPIKSVADLVRYAKENPNKLSYGSPGIGTAPHLAAELLKAVSGAEVTHVPYKGSPPALADTVAGHVHLTFADPATTPQLIAEGKVRALGVTSLERVAVLPNVPTLAESGLPGYQAMSWHVLAAPAGTPGEITQRLHTEMKAVMASPDVRKRITDIGIIPVDSPPPAEVTKFIQREIETWGQLVKRLNLQGSQ